MKIENIIREALEKAEKSASAPFHAETAETSLSSWECVKESLVSSVTDDFWWHIIRISHKRRMKRHEAGRSYCRCIFEELTEAGCEMKVRENSNGGLTVSLSAFEFRLTDSETGGEFQPTGKFWSYMFSVPPSDLVQYILAFNRYMEQFPSIAEKLATESMKRRQADRVLLVSAESMIGGTLKQSGINYRLSVDRRGRILCVMTRVDYPLYHKSCRSELDGLVQAVMKTIPQLYAYRFTGYVDE